MSTISESDQLALADGKWKPIPRVSRTIPFGYKLDEEDPNLLLPIPFELEALEKAKQHLKQYSYRAVAEWLSSITGRSISHVGLQKRVEIERSRRKSVAAITNWTKKLEEAKEKVERYNNQSLGAKEE